MMYIPNPGQLSRSRSAEASGESTAKNFPVVLSETWLLWVGTWLWYPFHVRKDCFLMPQAWHLPLFLLAPSRKLTKLLTPSGALCVYVCKLHGLNICNHCCVSTINTDFVFFFFIFFSFFSSRISVMIQYIT